MKLFFIPVYQLCIILATFINSKAMAQVNPLSTSQQLMVVVTNNWDNLQGTIYVFDKVENKWVLNFSNPIVVGGKGLGVGEGLVPFKIDGAPIKKEGDMKSPAGIFSFGTAFGYADYKEANWLKYPYKKASDTLICVDDMKSAFYNTLINKGEKTVDYNSYENMHLKKDYYKWGLFINHNAPNVNPGNGSCIFMHIWENDHSGTAGCTAMTEANLLKVLNWIRAEKHPLLVQFTKNEYDKIKGKFELPNLQ